MKCLVRYSDSGHRNMSDCRTAHCCVFWPAFGCCAHLEAGQNTFLEPFSTFFVHFKPKNQLKKTHSRYPLRESTSICVSTSFEEKTKMEKNTNFLFIFRRFFTEKSLKWTKKVENGSKKYIDQLSCRVHAALESWLKYTTVHYSSLDLSIRLKVWYFHCFI